MSWTRRWRWLTIAIGLAITCAIAIPFAFRQGEPPIKVGILLGTSDRSWSDFVLAVDLAAEELELPFSITESQHQCTVDLGTQKLLFQWHPEAGSRNIRYRVRELVRSPDRPIALVGANNSAMTQAMIEELASHADSVEPPVALLTYGTADYLLKDYPDRSFRFGFNNSYQARTVAARLKEYYQQRLGTLPKVNAVLVQVLDDPFSVDLARNFEKELSGQFQATFVPPLRPRPDGDASDGRKTTSSQAWSLTTCTGSFNTPSEEETELARNLVGRMVSNPDRQWVLVLPVGTDSFRRITSALSSALSDLPGRSKENPAAENLTILSGDSMNYYTFKNPGRSFLDPSKIPAPVILFAHVHPEDATVVNPPNHHVPSRGLNREVARALLTSLADEKARSGPAALAEALKQYRSRNRTTAYFRNHERAEGGGAILIVPQQDRFGIELPSAWK